MTPGIVRAALAVVVAVCAYLSWLIVTSTTVKFGAVAVSESSGIWQVVYGYVVTVAGVALGSAYRYLEGLRHDGKEAIPGITIFLGHVFKSIDFWLGLCGSPLVYALLLRATSGGNNAGLTAIAIENGFFCTMIVGKIHPKSLGRARAVPPKQSAARKAKKH